MEGNTMNNVPLRFDVLSISEWWNERQHEPGALTALKKVIEMIDDVSDATRNEQPASTSTDNQEMEYSGEPV